MRINAESRNRLEGQGGFCFDYKEDISIPFYPSPETQRS